MDEERREYLQAWLNRRGLKGVLRLRASKNDNESNLN